MPYFWGIHQFGRKSKWLATRSYFMETKKVENPAQHIPSGIDTHGTSIYIHTCTIYVLQTHAPSQFPNVISPVHVLGQCLMASIQCSPQDMQNKYVRPTSLQCRYFLTVGAGRVQNWL